ncbi:HlyD family type I secretion periplasmic adaptor subunit [Hyphococcus flavus]|uniref:Membrane fusion protein (MFP) family protein n=1 Tax=Hyphococcus flavus TaxID=1866326 RepID=A0AAF0CG05_9PROT|nr:HlyD family type I secretion periplasmic adaptor subunit [Hyphococcus flavus]WDI30162.1 HlyD family type I secretion periplasmic adaptor subunit [Hyphococcus flavus]
MSEQNDRSEIQNVGERHALALPIELEEGAPPHLARTAMAIVSGLVIMLLVWASIASIRELSVATGEIAPHGSTRQAAHFEGGIVNEVFVGPGDTVRAGQPIVELKKESGGGEFARASARRAGLAMRAERLEAQAAERTPDFSQWQSEWPDLVIEQKALFEAASATHEAKMAAVIAGEASAQAEVERMLAEHKSESELLNLANEQLAIQEKLIVDGFTSKQKYLDARASVSSAQARAAAAKSRLAQAREANETAKAERVGLEAEYKTALAEERSQVVSELAELEKPFASLRDRSDRLIVRAPIAGVVNTVTVDGAGDVVRPGEVVAEITPVGAELFAEVRVKPKDIGHITPGQKTELSVTTFDPNRYGKLSGVVSHISPDSFKDEKSDEAYYIAYIALDNQAIGNGRNKRMLSSGMEVRAEIVTQRRTVMQYILKPVARSLDHAFTER